MVAELDARQKAALSKLLDLDRKALDQKLSSDKDFVFLKRQVAPDVAEKIAALKLHARYYPLFKDLFIETNPVPVKAALALMGMVQEEYRLPLVPLSARSREVLRATLTGCGIKLRG